jgi:hypothetical protein
MNINENSKFPKININKLTGEIGTTILKKLVETELGWLYRYNHQENDFGIDGYIDIITDVGQITGKSIAFQLKSGKSYFNDQNEIGIVFNGDKKHLNYYLNIDIPIIIILLETETEEVYWEVFDAKKTEKSGENWKMTIPKTNKLNKSSKQQLLQYVSPITDYVSQLENEWKFNEILKKGNNRILFTIPKEEILEMKFDFITDALERVQNTPELILHMKSRVDISFNDYESDTRELFEIPEVKQWIVELFTKSNCFPYLFALDRASGFMKLAFFAHIQTFEKSIVNGRYKLEYDTKIASRFIETLFDMLNEYCEEKGLSFETNVEITEKIIGYFIDGKE